MKSNSPLHRLARRLAPALLLTGPLAAEVRIRDEGRNFLLDNGKISARIDKARGALISLKRGDQELIGGGGGGGYWSLSGSSGGGAIGAFPKVAAARITLDQGTVAEIAIDCRYDGAAGTWPVNVSFRYALIDAGEGLYLYGIFEHPAGLPAFSIGEGRYVVKPDPQVFDHLTIDPERDRQMPGGSDWDRGTPLNMKEVRRLTTGIHQGEVEHKYDYSALFSESPAYGWASTEKRIGLWMVTPSLEFIAGGPTKPELTGHLDVNPGGRPVLLEMWHGSHYGGSSLSVAGDEAWSKVVGPFLLQTNAGAGPLALWRQAMESATAEARKWPYPWIASPLYAAGGRVAASGRIILRDPCDPAARPGPMWVGLTAPDYEIRGRRGVEKVGWQRDGKFYQYWVRAAADGGFRLPAVRPGHYTLHAFADGVLGEFTCTDVEVIAGRPLNLGELVWTPDRAGPTVWEIGIPDRSAREFRHGDHYWEWGRYFRYQQEFPQGVDFTIGQSDWRRDWNIDQPLRLDAAGRVLGDSVWTVRFDLGGGGKPTHDHRLRIALCGHRADTRLSISINGRAAGDSGRLPENGVMHRDGHRGLLTELDFRLPAEALKETGNVLELKLDGKLWHQGILYDYLRLERVEPPEPRTPTP